VAVLVKWAGPPKRDCDDYCGLDFFWSTPCLRACRGQAETIKSIGKFFGAASGDAPHSEVTTDNAGEAAAAILVAPAAHTGHIYTISSPHFTYNDVSAGRW
jgi:hypothetical protein